MNPFSGWEIDHESHPQAPACRHEARCGMLWGYLVSVAFKLQQGGLSQAWSTMGTQQGKLRKEEGLDAALYISGLCPKLILGRSQGPVFQASSHCS